MNLNRAVLLLLALPLVLSFQQQNPGTTRLFNDNLELLNGHVKQLVETEHNHTTESEYPLSFITVTSFDKKGNIILQQTREIWEKKWKRAAYLFKYDLNGKKIETGVKLANKGIWVYKYNKDEKISESIFYWGKGKLEGKETYKYDSAGNVIATNSIEGEYFYCMQYKYDNKKCLIEEIEDPDKKGNGLNYLIEYKSFDTKGNWLKKIRLKQFGPTNMWSRDTITRKITYY